MKRLLLLSLWCALAWGQTAKFPAEVADDAHLKVIANRATTTLSSPIVAGSDAMVLADASKFKANMLLTIEDSAGTYEIVNVCAAGASIVTIGTATACPSALGRAQDGTTAIAHAAGARVSAYVDAWHHKAVAEEIKAIEGALGAGFALPLALAKGGTGASTAADARAALGLGLPLAVGSGGTGADTPAGARIALNAVGPGDSVAWTGTHSFASAAKTAPFRTGAADPGTCDNTVREMFFNTSTNLLKVCTALNTWSVVSGEPVNLPFANSADYDFTPQSPGTDLIAGNTTITLSPVPLGINWDDPGNYHWVRVTGGTDPDGVCYISTGGPGTATSGAASGTISLNCAAQHRGAYSIRSATAGIQEAIIAAEGGAGVAVWVPAGLHTIYAPITFNSGPTFQNLAITLGGMGTSSILQRATSFTAGNLIWMGSPSAAATGAEYGIHDLVLLNPSTLNVTSGAGIHVTANSAFNSITNVEIWNGYDGIILDETSAKLSRVKFFQEAAHAAAGYTSRYGLYLKSGAISGPSSVYVSDSDFFTQAPTAATGLVAGIRIEAADGVQIINSIANGHSGIALQTNGISDLNDVYILNATIDDVRDYGFFFGGATPPGRFVGNIHLIDSHIWAYSDAAATSEGAIDIAGTGGAPLNVQISGNNIGGFRNFGIRIGGSVPDAVVSGNMLSNIGGYGIGLVDGAARSQVIGNKLTNMAGGTFTLPIGILIDRVATNPMIAMNDASNIATKYSFNTAGLVTGLTGGDNAGFGHPNVASAATLVLPLTKSFTITGTITVTAINSPWAAGTSGTFITTGAVPFTAGATIGTAGTTSAGVVYSWTWDGTKLYWK